METVEKWKTIVAVGGGKGGVGKSIFSVALGATLARDGRGVVLADLDLGAANLHTCLGIVTRTPTIADFLMKRAPALEDVLIRTSVRNLSLISGADFIPGMANPAHWMKLKIMRHIRALPADVIIIDLGAGIHFNTLDFFAMASNGVIITAPEPGAVMNAYGFLKSALFRRLQNIFRKHPDLGPAIDNEMKKSDEETRFSLAWLTDRVSRLAPDQFPLIGEIEDFFSPALVVNRVTGSEKHVLVQNLLSLCSEKLGIRLRYFGNLPDSTEIGRYLLDIPGFLESTSGMSYKHALEGIAARIVADKPGDATSRPRADLNDAEVDEIIRFMESLDDSVFGETSKESWKLRMYFRPLDVIRFLTNRGISHAIFQKVV